MFLQIFLYFAIAGNLFHVGSTYPNLPHRSNNLNEKHLLKQLAEYAHRSHMVATKRCANLFDESCANGGLPGANNDEEWLNNLGKRCANLFDEGCPNGGLPESSEEDDEWLEGLGKRQAENDSGFFKSLGDFFNRVHMVTTKRCANLFDEGCANGGIPEAGNDQSWLEGIGKRCANLFDEGCANGGIPEAGDDQSWLEGIGKRNANSEKSIYKSIGELFNRLAAARERRCANLFDESCANGGLPGANNDEEWLNNLGKRDLKGILESIHLG